MTKAKTLVMNSSDIFRKILDECLKGNFDKTLDYINKHLEENITSQIALRILRNCGEACYYKKENITEESLLQVLKKIRPYLRDLNENDFLSYVRVMNHIIKFLIYKVSLEIIVQMESMLIPEFQPEKLSAKHIEVYHNTAVLLHNFIPNSLLYNEVCHELVFKISILLVQICTKFLDIKTTIRLASGCFTNLNIIKIKLQYRIQYTKILFSSLNYTKVKPKYEEIFECVQYLSYNILNNLLIIQDFETAKDFLNDSAVYMRNTLDQEDYVHFYQVLNFFLVPKYNSTSEIDKSTQSLSKLSKTWEKVMCSRDSARGLSSLLSSLKQYYISNPTEWYSLSEKIQLKMIKFIDKLHSLQISDKTEQNLYAGLSYSTIINSLIKIYVTHNCNSTIKYHQECVKIVKSFCNHVQVLRINNFEHWGKAWNMLGIEIYNIGHNLYQKSNRASVLYVELIIKCFVNLEDVNCTVYLNYVALKYSCTMLIDIYSTDIQKSLSYIALAVFLCNKDRGSFLEKWIMFKYNLKDNKDIQKTNLVSALQSLQEDIPELNIEKADQIYLLDLELEHYKKRKWMTAIPIASVLKELIDATNTENVARIIVKIFIDTDLPNNDEIRCILERFLKTYKSDAKSSVSEVNLAVLYYIYYKLNHKRIISKNAIDMEKAASVISPKKESNTLEPSEAKEGTDIASSFECLKLEGYIENLKILESSLALLKSLVPKLKEDTMEHVKILHLYNVLLDISSLYKLSRFNIKVMQALELALKLAQQLDDEPCIIKCIGLIIEQTGLKTEFDQTLVKFAETLMEKKNFISNNLELSILYYICKSKALLYNSYQEAFNVFKTAKSLLESSEDNKGFRALRSQLCLLNSKFGMIPCNLEMENYKRRLLMNLHSALEIMFEESRNAKLEDAYKLSVLIEVSEEFIKLYHYLKCPREVRIYAKQVVLITQNLVLPLTCASFLMYLAHADLLSNYKDESFVKVQNMASILSLKSNGKMYERPSSSSSSPNFLSPSFQMPSTIQHKTSCGCFYCNCCEYQVLVLEKFRLNALINIKEKNLAIAEEFFKGALRLYECYSQKREDFVPEFLSTYGYILLNFSSHLYRTNSKDAALILNKKLQELTIEGKKLQHVHIYNEILVQKLGFLLQNVLPEPEPELQITMDNLQIVDSNSLQKTPENKQSQVSVTVQHFEYGASPHMRVKKCLPLSFSPTEIHNIKVSTKNSEKTQFPQIQIFSDSVVETGNTHFSETGITPKTKISAVSVKKSRKKANSVLHKSSKTDSSSSVVVEKALKTRTKLLTEKLKKKTELNSDVENQMPTGSRINSSRKNLMKDLAESENDQKMVGKGAIRKSSRTKK